MAFLILFIILWGCFNTTVRKGNGKKATDDINVGTETSKKDVQNSSLKIKQFYLSFNLLQSSGQLINNQNGNKRTRLYQL